MKKATPTNPLVLAVQNRIAEDAKRAALEDKLNDAAQIHIADTGNHFAATDVEGALVELQTNVTTGKGKIATAITNKGVTATGSETFDQLAGKIDTISVGTGTSSNGEPMSPANNLSGSVSRSSVAEDYEADYQFAILVKKV